MNAAAASDIAPRVHAKAAIGVGVAVPRAKLSPVVPAMIVGAWLVVLAAQATGTVPLLHHHALIEGGPPLWAAIPLFLVAWQVMVAAMMLPASLPAVRAFQVESRRLGRPGPAVAAFLGTYGIVWAVFGFLAFMGDLVLHRVVDASPWLAAHQWLIEATILALAGGYQLLPIKRRALAACRHQGDPIQLVAHPAPGPGRLGLRHGLDCLGSSWALMLVMFAAGFASLWSMAALTVLMVYEVRGRHGQGAAAAAGVILLLAALTTVSGPLPGGA